MSRNPKEHPVNSVKGCTAKEGRAVSLGRESRALQSVPDRYQVTADEKTENKKEESKREPKMGVGGDGRGRGVDLDLVVKIDDINDFSGFDKNKDVIVRNSRSCSSQRELDDTKDFSGFSDHIDFSGFSDHNNFSGFSDNMEFSGFSNPKDFSILSNEKNSSKISSPREFRMNDIYMHSETKNN